MTEPTVNLDLGVLDGFEGGLLLDLQKALRSTSPGDLFSFTSPRPGVREDLDRWARLTENSIILLSEVPGGTRFVIRNGPAPREEAIPIGERLWLYTNFDCNLACDYCCVRSSPKAERRALGLDTVRQIAREAPALGVRQIMVTGGEPLLLPDIAEILELCAQAAPSIVLSNGILLHGRRLGEIDRLDRGRLAFQISLDSAEPDLHDQHRGAGSWKLAMRGLEAARRAGFRVRLAATVKSDAEARAFEAFLDQQAIPAEDRVIRPIARRGVAEEGVAIARADLVPEVTITSRGVYWHPVGADDRDLLVTETILPLSHAFAEVRRAFEQEAALSNRLLSIFHCA